MIDKDEAQLRFDCQLADLMHTMSDLGMQVVQFSGVQWEPRNQVFSIKFHTTGLREPVKPLFNLGKLCEDARARLLNSLYEDIYQLRKHVKNGFADARYDSSSRHMRYQSEAERSFEKAAWGHFGTTIDNLTWEHIYNRCPSMG